jgi:hypothetical protein
LRSPSRRRPDRTRLAVCRSGSAVRATIRAAVGTTIRTAVSTAIATAISPAIGSEVSPAVSPAVRAAVGTTIRAAVSPAVTTDTGATVGAQTGHCRRLLFHGLQRHIRALARCTAHRLLPSLGGIVLAPAAHLNVYRPGDRCGG